MKREFKKTIAMANTLLDELERGFDYFWEERLHRHPAYNGPRLDRSEEIKQNSKNIMSLCDEIQSLTKEKEDAYEQTDFSI